MAYPNVAWWSALKDRKRIEIGDETYELTTHNCGELIMPSGALIVCDPFAVLSKSIDFFIQVPKGQFPVVMTLADVSGRNDGSHMREAYLTLLLVENEPEVRRRIITPIHGNERANEEMGDDGSYHGFPVDAGTACFVDAEAVRECMPAEDTWERIFESESSDSWFNKMDDTQHIREGLANIKLPLAKAGENIILCHSGWGDGHYPVVGGYNSKDELVRVHIDFFVVDVDDDT